MSKPKFIVESNEMVISKCTYHKQLAENEKNVKGGGLFSFEPETKTFTLSGASFDFGAAKLEDIKTCIESNQVYRDKLRVNKFDTSEFKFVYMEPWGEKIELN